MAKIKYAVVGILLIAVALTTIQAATAITDYKNEFNTKYGTSGTRLDTCGLCHVNPAGGGSRTSYGQAFRNQSMHSSDPAQAFANIEALDSDGDGYSNIAEILARTFPGNASDHPAPAPVLTTITVTPATKSLTIGGTQQFTAAAKDQNGNPFSTTFTWSSSNTTVGTVSSTGLFTADVNGIATVTANSGSVNGTATVTVIMLSPPVLTTITVTPSTASLAINGTQTFTATTLDQYGNPINATVTWSSSNTTVGTINNSTGQFKALANGTTTITATHGSINGSATVTVGAPASIPSPAGTAQVTFTIIDNKTGKPVREAEVTLDGVTKETNRTGQVTFNNVSTGNHSYTVAREDDDHDDDNDDDESEHNQISGTINVTGNVVIQLQLTHNEGHANGHDNNHGNHYGDHHGLKRGHDDKCDHDHKCESRTTDHHDDDEEEDDDS
ncbi:MAG: Ig-like domain-containing protein [Thaumarchaeota archaeon]|nr:Ig-like domain-containing protein [Nitrososphaerota archaeon]